MPLNQYLWRFYKYNHVFSWFYTRNNFCTWPQPKRRIVPGVLLVATILYLFKNNTTYGSKKQVFLGKKSEIHTLPLQIFACSWGVFSSCWFAFSNLSLRMFALSYCLLFCPVWLFSPGGCSSLKRKWRGSGPGLGERGSDGDLGGQRVGKMPLRCIMRKENLFSIKKIWKRKKWVVLMWGSALYAMNIFFYHWLVKKLRQPVAEQNKIRWEIWRERDREKRQSQRDVT